MVLLGVPRKKFPVTPPGIYPGTFRLVAQCLNHYATPEPIYTCCGCNYRPPSCQLHYRVIHKSLRDFRPLRYSSRDGHAEGEHVNRGRDTQSFYPTSAILGSRDLLTSEGSWHTFLAHVRQSRPMAPAGLFVSQRTGSHSARISCTTHELFCP